MRASKNYKNLQQLVDILSAVDASMVRTRRQVDTDADSAAGKTNNRLQR